MTRAQTTVSATEARTTPTTFSRGCDGDGDHEVAADLSVRHNALGGTSRDRVGGAGSLPALSRIFRS